MLLLFRSLKTRTQLLLSVEGAGGESCGSKGDECMCLLCPGVSLSGLFVAISNVLSPAQDILLMLWLHECFLKASQQFPKSIVFFIFNVTSE